MDGTTAVVPFFIVSSWGKIVRVVNQTRAGAEVLLARRCRSFLCRLRGLMFRRALPGGVGLLLEEGVESRAAAAIHMLAVFMPLGVVWLDSDLTVVDKRQADPWRFYVPREPARYVLEGPVSVLESVAVGDQLEIQDALNTHTHSN